MRVLPRAWCAVVWPGCLNGLQGTSGAGAAAPQSALQGISGIKVDPKDFEETTKRSVQYVH